MNKNRNAKKNRRLWRVLILMVSLTTLVLFSVAWLAPETWYNMGSTIEESTNTSSELRHNERTGNHLVNETSPYLLMHAYNPVEWYPWGEEALSRARREDKPIFLSVGYSTCYWCQVMERESFVDDEVARVLNEHFIAIKVDREQRPDLDEQYMLATQLVTGRGGWPNSVWLTPDGRPWMAGTYFPRDRFIQILTGLANVWDTRRDEVEQQADQLAASIRQIGVEGYGGNTAVHTALDMSLFDTAIQQYRDSFDETYGGFGGAPKFPPHDGLTLLFMDYEQTKDPALLRIITKTLDAMWLGGMHDHIGGGFHRYTTDRIWLVPHFEKMLYDNAQLMKHFVDGYRISHEARYRDAVEDIYRWLVRDMTNEEGAFYSAINSEVGGEEGRTYVWKHEDIEEILGHEDAVFFADIYHIERGGNYREERSGRNTGENILFLSKPLSEIAKDEGISRDSLTGRLEVLRNKLLTHRKTLEQPHIDDKVLTSWNSLMIESLAYAGRVLDDPRYTRTAGRCARFLLNTMYSNNTLYRSYREGVVEQPGYLDDYAYFASSLIELYQATGNDQYLEEAGKITDRLVGDFQDQENGGFFFTTLDDHENLLLRSKNLTGGGNVPGANGVAIQVLLKLDALHNREQYRQKAEEALVSLTGVMQSSPRSMESTIAAVFMWFTPPDLQAPDQPNTTLIFNAGLPERENLGTPDAIVVKHPVSIHAYASRLTASPGDTFNVALRVDIKEGWHIYGENREVNLLPTTVSLRTQKGITELTSHQPQPHVTLDPILKRNVVSYDGQIWFVYSIVVDESLKPKAMSLAFDVEFQACSRQNCLFPDSTVIELPVSIEARSSQPSAPRHIDLFDRLPG